MNDLRHLIESTLVPHTAFTDGLDRLEWCFEYAQRSSEPMCVALIGESRTGKSRVLDEFVHRHPSIRLDDGLQVPVLSIKTPSRPTVKSLCELMLFALGDPQYLKGTENAKSLRLRILMRNTETKMVLIDEFQHFYDKGLKMVMHHVADWLKVLVDDTRVSLVVSGLPTCRAVISQNEQLKGRFLAPTYMPRFEWENPGDRAEFQAILAAFHEELRLHFDLPALDSQEMAFRCYCATGGLIGYLANILREAVMHAVQQRKTTITMADLGRAHRNAVWPNDELPAVAAPFARSFMSAPNLQMLEQARQIGDHVEAPVAGRTRKRASARPGNISQLLTGR